MNSADKIEQQSMEAIDWSTFRFPTRPGGRSTQEVMGGEAVNGMARAPSWAAPPQRIDSWHLDLEQWMLTHPGQRKKVDLLRITTRRRLALVVDMITTQPNVIDQGALWGSLNQAVQLVFGMGLGEMLAIGPDFWEWPDSLGQKKGGQKTGEKARQHREAPGGKMGLNGM